MGLTADMPNCRCLFLSVTLKMVGLTNGYPYCKYALQSGANCRNVPKFRNFWSMAYKGGHNYDSPEEGLVEKVGRKRERDHRSVLS